MIPLQTSTYPLVLPTHTDLFYGGQWHPPLNATFADTYNPATGEVLDRVTESSAQDADAAVEAAREGFKTWRRVPPLERAKIMRRIAVVIPRARGDDCHVGRSQRRQSRQ